MSNLSSSGPADTVNPIPWDQFTSEFRSLDAPPKRAPATRNKMRLVLRLVADLGVGGDRPGAGGPVHRLEATRPEREHDT